MSAINTGVFPSPNPTTINDITQTQVFEGENLTIIYEDLQDQLATTTGNYNDDVALFNLVNSGAEQNYENKPINTIQKTSYNVALLTSEETQVWVNTTFDSTADRVTLYAILVVNFLTPQVNPIHSIRWTCITNFEIVNMLQQDLGNYIVTDVSNKWNIPFLFEIPTGSALNSTYIVAQVLSDFNMEVPVTIGVRVFKMNI